MRLEGKVAIVTGGGQGIGKVYSRALASEGAKVVMAEIDEAAVKAAEQEFRAKDLDVIALPTDVSNEAAVQRMVDQTVERFGRIDILVNNAAWFATLPHHPLTEISVDEWDRTMAINMRGVFLCARAVLPHMKAQGGGSIINVSSSTIIGGGATGGMVHYVTSKAGVWGFSRALAREVGEHNIRVNSLAPGATLSETVIAASGRNHDRIVALRSLKRTQDPEDMVGALLYLATDDSAFMTGQMVTVDGGKDLY